MSDVAFILIDPPSKQTSLVNEWRRAFAQHLQPRDLERFSFLDKRLKQLQEENVTFDCIVSPANSYGIMDGGFDYHLSMALSPPEDFGALTRLVQTALRKRYFGFAPPGTCTLVPLHASLPPNVFGCTTLAVCPTMRYPEVITWHKDVVYNTMWTLLVEIEHWNAARAAEHSDAGGEEEEEEEKKKKKIRKVVMTGLGTGVGRIPAATCARQMALAVKHFLYARRGEGPPRALDDDDELFSWDKALDLAGEVQTW